MKDEPIVLVENFEDGVSLFTINRESRRNAICSDTAKTLQDEFVKFDKSEQRVAVITGAGTRAFSAGADVDDVPQLWRCIPTIGIKTEKPVISAVSGWCVGGGLVVAMMSDLVVATTDAKFYYPEAKLGLAQGVIAGLAARIPHKVAMEIILLARIIDAERAYNVGLINEVVPPGQHVDRALELARELAPMAPLVLKLLKRFVVNGVLPRGPTELFGLANADIDEIAQSEDIKEGFQAYRESRKPIFQGR